MGQKIEYAVPDVQEKLEQEQNLGQQMNLISKDTKEGRILQLAIYRSFFSLLFQNGGFNHENKWTERLYRNISNGYLPGGVVI